MSVIITLQLDGDPRRLEEAATSDADRTQRIVDRAKEAGLIAHRFYGADDGKIMVIDEWPDAESFQRFFDGAGDEIGPLFESAGISGEPTVTVWRKLETNDDYGWNA